MSNSHPDIAFKSTSKVSSEAPIGARQGGRLGGTEISISPADIELEQSHVEIWISRKFVGEPLLGSGVAPRSPRAKFGDDFWSQVGEKVMTIEI